MKELSEDQIYTMYVDYQWALAAPEDYMQGLEDGFCSGLEWMIKAGYVAPTEKALNLIAKYRKSKGEEAA